MVQDLEELYEQYLPRRSSCDQPRLVQEDQEELPHTPPARAINTRSTKTQYLLPQTNAHPEKEVQVKWHHQAQEHAMVAREKER